MSTLVTSPERPAPKLEASLLSPASARRQQPSYAAALIWLSAAIVALPLLLRGPAAGPDFIFHYTSWHDALNAWRHGIAYPHWAASPNFGAGEPRFVFYPPLVWMLGAALGAILPWHVVPAALTFLMLAAAGFATRALARLFLPGTAALLAGCTSVFSAYGLYELYYHGDFAMVSGGFWIPVLLLLFFRGGRSERASISSSIIDRQAVLLALALCGTWLSNTPLGLMATYLLVTMALASAFQTRSWAPIARVIVAITLGLGLAGFYLVPASIQQHWVDIQALFASPEHLVQNRWITRELASAHQRKRGVVELCMLAMSLGGLALTWWRGRWPPSSEARRHWLALAIIPAAVLFLMLPISLPVWNIVPRLRYLQYPLRWLVVLQAPMAIFFAAAVWSLRARLRPLATSICAVAFVLSVAATSRSTSFFRPGSAAASGPYSLAAMDRALAPGGGGVGGTEEYATPPGAQNGLIAAQAPDACLVPDASAPLSTVPATNPTAFYAPKTWSPTLQTCKATFGQDLSAATPEHFDLSANLDEPGYMVLRLRSYPAWKVMVNGQRMRALPRRNDGLIAVEVPQGPVHITVDWTDYAGRSTRPRPHRNRRHAHGHTVAVGTAASRVTPLDLDVP